MINPKVIPLLTYTCSIVSWFQTDLHSLERSFITKTRGTNTHHTDCSSDRFLLPKSEDGVEITDIHTNHVKSLRNYFHSKKKKKLPPIPNYVCDKEVNHTLLNLHDPRPTKRKHQNDTRKNNKVEEQNSTSKRAYDHEKPDVYKTLSNA